MENSCILLYYASYETHVKYKSRPNIFSLCRNSHYKESRYTKVTVYNVTYSHCMCMLLVLASQQLLDKTM